MSREVSIRDAWGRASNEGLKAQHAFGFHVVKTVADFVQQLASIHEHQSEELQLLVETFRKKNAELKRERTLSHNSLLASWEAFLQEVEVDSQVHSDIASVLSRQVSVPLLEKTFYRKIQSRKLFTHRESYETILTKTEELLLRCYKQYNEAAHCLLRDQSSANLSAYYATHNAYVQQLHAANAMIDEYYSDVLPQLLDELEEVYLDLSSIVSKSINDCANVIFVKAHEQLDRYDSLRTLASGVVGKNDLTNYIRSLNVDKTGSENTHHEFTPPQFNGTDTDTNTQELVPLLKDELIVDVTSSSFLSSRSSYDSLKQELNELTVKMKQIQEALDSMIRLQQRSIEGALFNKANELQEEISLKRFDLRVTQIHLAAVRAQVACFGAKLDECGVEGGVDDVGDRKMSASSTGSMKSKWLKAFKSLKGDNWNATKRKESRVEDLPTGENGHLFQEYTYKKIAACDVCKEILRGHTRQGLRCKLCKTNVHVDCQSKAARCNPKSRLLRRQRSTSELESRVVTSVATDDEKRSVDPIYQLLKQAGDLSGKRVNVGGTSGTSSTSSSSRIPASLSVNSPPASISAPHSPQRHKLNLRMKSLSLDSPESNEHVQRVRRTQQQLQQQPSSLSSSHSQSPQSPVHSRRLLATKTVRMSSVDLPDDNEKSFSSASTSPCPSPKPHRLLPTNLYVVLFNFRARQTDELDLKAGETITVIDTSDADWWKGKGVRRGGFFPSKYVAKLNPGERPLQVTHNLQISDGDNGLKLLRDQIVIQMGEEQQGMVLVRSGEKKGFCPLRYLQEI